MLPIQPKSPTVETAGNDNTLIGNATEEKDSVLNIELN